MTMTYEEAPSMNGHDATEPTDRKKLTKQIRDLLEHDQLGPQLATEIREVWEDLRDQEEQAHGTAKRRLGDRRHLLGLLLVALEGFHGIDDA